MANEDEWICKSCGHEKRNIQLRMVSANLGQGTLQVSGVVPVCSCQQCGTLQVDHTVRIGELVQLGAPPAQSQQRQSTPPRQPIPPKRTKKPPVPKRTKSKKAQKKKTKRKR